MQESMARCGTTSPKAKISITYQHLLCYASIRGSLTSPPRPQLQAPLTYDSLLELPSKLLLLGSGPAFGLFAGDKGRAIEHVAVVIGRLRIPGLGLGRLPGVRVHALRLLTLEDAPGPAPLLLGRVAGLRGVPVGTHLLA